MVDLASVISAEPAVSLETRLRLENFSCDSGAESPLLSVEKGRKSSGQYFHPGIYSSRTPQVFCPKTGIKPTISLLPQKGGATLWKQTPSWEDPLFWGLWGHFLSQGHRGLPWSCSQVEGSQDVLPNGARTDWIVQDLFGKHCRSHMPLPSRRRLSLGRTSVAASTLLWKGTIWSRRNMAHSSSRCLPACGEFGPAWWHAGPPGVPGHVKSCAVGVECTWHTLGHFCSLIICIEGDFLVLALRATLNSQCRHLTPSIIQSHLYTSSSFCFLGKKAFYISVHLGHSSLLLFTQLCKTAHNIRKGKVDLP